MERKFYISKLLDFYGGLLPENQTTCLTQYYNDDLSLAEISENIGISRQGVRDLIKRGEATLEKLESELKLSELYKDIVEFNTSVAAELSQIADECGGVTAERLNAIAEKINSRDVY